MCNDAMRVAVAKKPKNKFELINLSNSRLREYGLHSHYVLSACEVAYSAYSNKKRRSTPHFSKPFLKLDNQTYKLNYLILRIPIAPRRYVYLTLDGSAFHRSFLSNPNLKLGSAIVTESKVVIAFSKEAVMIERKGTMGLDVNERNVTWSDSLGESKVEDTSVICEVKELYSEIRARIIRRTRKDRKILIRLLNKYGKRRKNRVNQRIHKISRRIVEHAKKHDLDIVMEDLTGIRKRYSKGNGQGGSFRGRMHSWSFHEIQRQVEYKARWEGIRVTFVDPRGTSRNCPECGSLVAPLQERKLFCSVCDKIWDRDVLASLNIMAASSVRAERSPVCSDEEETQRQKTMSNPLSRRVEGAAAEQIQAKTPEP